MQIKSKEISIVEIDSLVLNPDNNNRHSIEQIELLAKGIKHNGFRVPIIVSNRSGFVISGHGRIDAAKKLEIKEVPVIYEDFENEAEEYQFLTFDNEIARWAELDRQAVYDKIEILGLDIELLGIEDFSLPEVEVIPECDEDAVPELKEDPITKRGDVWLLGNHRVMCGDSTMIDDVEKLMKGEKADMVFTDPPYGMNFQSNFKTEKFNKIENDDKILDIAPVIWEFLKDNCAAYVFTRWDVYPKWFEQFLSFNIKNCITWIKGGGGLGDLKHSYSPNHEFAIVAHKGNAKLRGKREKDSWEIGRDDVNSYVHPTQKPVGVSEFAMINHSDSGQIILDLFLGSGSTLIACEKTNRKCYGMELDEHYCDVIINRWQKYSGKQATLESSGELYDSLRDSQQKA